MHSFAARGERKGFLLFLWIGRMGHLAGENSISIGFCGGFYCHMGCNAASEGLYGLPRKISGAGCWREPCWGKREGEKRKAQGSTKGLLINFYQSQRFAPDQIYSSTLLYFHSVFYSCCGSRSEVGHGHAAYRQEKERALKSPGVWLKEPRRFRRLCSLRHRMTKIWKQSLFLTEALC